MTATVTTTGNANTGVTWASSNTGVATTGAAGAVTSLSIGSTIITATSATDPSKSDSITLTVNPPGTLAWTRQFGTSSTDYARAIAAGTNGHVYAAGRTVGALEGSHLGSDDAFIRSYDSNGDHRWTRQFGTTSSDEALGIATDADGHVYTTGYATGALEGSHLGSLDAFIRKYGP